MQLLQSKKKDQILLSNREILSKVRIPVPRKPNKVIQSKKTYKRKKRFLQDENISED